MVPTPVLLPRKSHGWRSLVGCSPWGGYESDPTERLHFHFSLSCTGEGNGSPLQCSCLENPRDEGAWLAAIYAVTQSWTRLKRLSSSISIIILLLLKLVVKTRFRKYFTFFVYPYFLYAILLFVFDSLLADRYPLVLYSKKIRELKFY